MIHWLWDKRKKLGSLPGCCSGLGNSVVSNWTQDLQQQVWRVDVGEEEFSSDLLSLKSVQWTGRYRRSKLRNTLKDSYVKIWGPGVLVKTVKADEIKEKVWGEEGINREFWGTAVFESRQGKRRKIQTLRHLFYPYDSSRNTGSFIAVKMSWWFPGPAIE